MDMIEGEDKRFTCSVDENIELSEGFCPLLTLLTSLLTLLTSYFLEVLTGPLIFLPAVLRRIEWRFLPCSSVIIETRAT